MSDEVSCTVIEFSKSDLFTWSDLVNLLKDYPKKDLKFFSKTCTSGRKKVCVGIKVTGGTKFFQIVRPCTRNQVILVPNVFIYYSLIYIKIINFKFKLRDVNIK